MDCNEIRARILQARNTLSLLHITGIEDMRRLVTIYDHLTQTAEMLHDEERVEAPVEEGEGE